MSGLTVDLFEKLFWVVYALTLLAVVPQQRAAPRKWALAIGNLAFIAALLGWQFFSVLGVVIVACVLLWSIAKSQSRFAISIAAFCVIALFLVHKLPLLSHELGLAQANAILTTIGFSYVALRFVDVLRAVAEKRQRAPDLPSTVNYLLPLHALAAGPIQSYDEFVNQPEVPPALSTRAALEGVERIVSGLFKKYVLALTIQRVFLSDFRAGGWYFLLEVQLHYIWLYLDFSAYSDIAVGLGGLLGVATPENFNKPYLARNMIAFWERWHISLSLFIRRHVFIPLQLWLMRKIGVGRPVLVGSIAFTISFLLCGLWHGIGWNFFLWGAIHAAGLVLCNVYKAFLGRSLGRAGVQRYLQNRFIGAIAVCVTFEYVAMSLVVLYV